MGNATSRDGAVTRFTEKIPVVGLVTAAVQAAAGNEEHAKRALANQANAIITTAGTVAGFAVGGPVGAVAGGALASSAGIGAEYAVSTTINDPNVKGDTGNVSVQRFVMDGALAGAGGMLGGGSAGTLAKQVGTGFSKEVAKSAAGTATKTLVGATVAQTIQAASDTVTGRTSGQQTGGPGLDDPEDPDKGKSKELLRAVTDYQAHQGHGFVGLLNQLARDFVDYSPTHAEGSLTDMTNNAVGVLPYFQRDVLHASCLEKWNAVKDDLTRKMVTGTRLEGVRRVINERANAGEITIAQRDLLFANLERQRAAILSKMNDVDAALAGEAEYCIPAEQIRQPQL
ncbi:hypothetical protein QM012_000975 [Aureobasidium pullulans]|uniref:DUF726-domain-containing protein n=1 Tax=Aureobasidium pullulans TaxID=5580 RepID=A0ABR0TGP0_AURPU